MKYNIEDYLGKKVSEDLEVVGLDNSFNKRTFNANHWIFKCSCGKEFSEMPSRILKGHKKSCGCKRYTGALVHGLNGDEFFHTWYSMMQRCYNEKHHNYHRYGERGIIVCKEWHEPKNFIEWAHSTVGEKYDSLTLDRIDNDKGYSPENCRWATKKQQARNRSTTRYETIDGIRKPLSEWCEEYGIEYYVVLSRCNELGWSIEDAVKTPKFKASPKSEKKNGVRRNARILVEIDGVSKNVSDWCKIYGLDRSTIYGRIRNGIDPQKAILGGKPRAYNNMRYIEYNGETHYLKEWADILGMNVTTLNQRFRYGWSVEKSLTTPVKKRST